MLSRVLDRRLAVILGNGIKSLDGQIPHAVDPHHVWKAAAIGDHAGVAVNAMAKCANLDPQSPNVSRDRGNTPSAAWPTWQYADACALMEYTRGDLND